MNCRILTAVLLSCLLAPPSSHGEEKASAPASGQKVLRIGAVAYSPSVVTIFQGIQRYLNRNGLPADYVLYSHYDALVKALQRGEIDVAWNTPLAHARFHLACGGKSQTLVMRDVDKDLRSVLIVRKGANIQGLSDLENKTLALGSPLAAEATVLPLYYLKKARVDFAKIKLLDLSKEVDFRGNPCSSPQHVLKAVQEGRAEAGIIGERLWQRLQKDRGKTGDLQQVWISPAYHHCVFTAPAGLDTQLGRRFSELMQKMDPQNPLTAEAMRLEGTRQWLPSDPEGFADLIEAIQKR